jgi:serine/threonine-protein kinase
MTDILDRLGSALADRYTIERELGAGGMATVYLAQDLRHDRKVAIKVLRPELAAVIGADRFLSEIKTTANLQHPHILPLFDSGAADSFLFYVMPYVEGESLRDRITREHQLPVADAVRLATEIAGALDYAHRQGVIHRDIKPENVMLHDGQALVADFGIALAMANTAGTRMTETGMSLGTPHYMSPEQAMGEREITGRSDVYALGAITYEMLCGEPPFTGPTAQAIIARVMTEEPRGLTLQRKSIPPAVEGAVRQALEKLPADRFATAAEFAAALKDPSATSYRTAATVAAPGKANALRTGLLLGLAAGAVSAWLATRILSPAEQPPLDPVAFQLKETGELTAGVAQTIRPSILISPDGRTMAYLGQTGGQNHLVVRELASLSARILPGTSGATDPVFSPDGGSIAFRQGGALHRVALNGTAPIEFAQLGQSPAIYGITWFAPDTIAYLIEASPFLYKVSVNGNAAPVALPLPDSVGLLAELAPIPGTEWLLSSLLGTMNFNPELIALSSRDASIRRLGVNGRAAQLIDGGRHVLIGKDNGIVTIARFDVSELRIVGQEIPVLDDMQSSVLDLPNVTVAANGTMAYLTGNENDRTLVEVTRDGRERVLVDEIGEYKDPRYSPDGTKVSYEVVEGNRGDIWIHDKRTGTETRLTNESENLYPLWTPDGSRLIFTSRRAGLAGLWSQRVDRSEAPVQLLPGSDDRLRFPHDITKDGEVLIYRTNTGDNGMDLGWIRLDGTGAEESIMATPDNESTPVLSPDERWMAFTSDGSGSNEIYLTPWPEAGARVQLSAGGGTEPQWNPNGSELFYRTGEAMVAVTLAGTSGALPQPVRWDTLFSGSYFSQPRWPEYDVSSDGERFVMVKSGTKRPEIVVITNWVAQAVAQLESAGGN